MVKTGPEKHRFRIFLDTDALFAGIWSPTGGRRMILKLAEARDTSLEFVISSQVLRELEEVLRKTALEVLGYQVALLDRCRITIASEIAPETLEKNHLLVSHPGDARVLAEACTAGVDYLATLDQRHFLANDKLRTAVPFKVGTPGDFLAWFKEMIT